MERNTSIGNVLMRTLSQTAFLTFSDPLLESANLRKIHNMARQQFWPEQRLEMIRAHYEAETFLENRLD
jgi:hypothetical protein